MTSDLDARHPGHSSGISNCAEAKEKARGTAMEPRAVSYWESGIIGFLNPLARVALQSA